MLTIEQKIEAYKWVREATGDPENYVYVCPKLNRWLGENGYNKNWQKFFPEWLSMKPGSQPILLSWWPEESPLRLQALDQVIEELEKQLKEKE